MRVLYTKSKYLSIWQNTLYKALKTTKLRGRLVARAGAKGWEVFVGIWGGWTRWAMARQPSGDDALALAQPNQKRMGERRIAKLWIPFGHTPEQLGEGDFTNRQMIEGLDGIENRIRSLFTSLGNINVDGCIALGIPEPGAHEKPHNTIAGVTSLLKQLSSNGDSQVFTTTNRPPRQLHGV